MLIRKLFKFEGAHIVRGCTSGRCKFSLHGHSYKVELILHADALDNGQMVYDFGLLKSHIFDVIDGFDHAICFYNKDDAEYINACKTHSERYVGLPVSPSAEQFCRVFFYLADKILAHTQKHNGEQGVRVHSVIVHETDTGYAQCFIEDVQNPQMGVLNLADFEFSDGVRADWRMPDLLDKLMQGETLDAPKPSTKKIKHL